MAPEINQLAIGNDQLTIQVNNLSKRFNREWIFKNLTYTFQAGKTYAITGPNGSGKSTLLQILWGQLPQTSGSIQYTLPSQLIPVEDIFRHVVIATPYMELIEELTLEEHLRFHFNLRSMRAGYTLESLLDKLSLTHARDKRISEFSSGMKQRVKLGLAFFTHADAIFLDEPGTNLDEQAFAWYKEQLAELPKESLIFIASNQRNEYSDTAEVLNLAIFK
jgi:ABC-type multidrug transport system ATPase subunit